MHPCVRSVSVALCATAFVGLSNASADLINIAGNSASSTEHLGAFTGSLSYTPVGANAASLVLTLTNTTAPATGGYITAVALLNADNFAGITMVLTASDDADFGNLAALVSAPPFGSYRGGASTGGSWTGGGAPSPGTGIGQTLILTFSLNGTGAGLHSASDFIGLHTGHQDLVVRFRGMSNDGSDKVPGMVVPVPGAAAVLGMGGLAAIRRRR